MKKVIRLPCIRVRDEDVLVTIVVVVSDRDRRPACGEHVQDFRILALKLARVMENLDAGLFRYLFKPNRVARIFDCP